MDTKSKNYSHSIITKVIVFIITIVCFTSAITTFVNTLIFKRADLDIITEDTYYETQEFMLESQDIIETLISLINEYKSKEHILNGGTVTEDKIKRKKEEKLFLDSERDSKRHDHNLSREENYTRSQEIYADQISQVKDEIIKEDLKKYNLALQKLNTYDGVVYYASGGVNIFTNTRNKAKYHFKGYPSYIIFDKFSKEVYPKEIANNTYSYMIKENIKDLDSENSTVHVCFTDEFLNPRIREWEENKRIVTNSIYRMVGSLLGLILSFIYLLLIIGRKSFKDKEVHLNFVDKLYNDLNLIICFSLIILWFRTMGFVSHSNFYQFVMVFVITMSIATLGLIFVLSLVKHIKNRTIIKHTLSLIILRKLYRLTKDILYKLYRFIKDIYNSGSVGVKIVVIVVGYPILVALTFFIFPVTIGAAVWLALKKIKEFNTIIEGVEKIKNGDIHHVINIPGKGEFAKLATNINSITDGLNKAVDNELKSQRLKTELITNVSHDIRTPLTSIITYVDLCKKEEDISKRKEYIEIIEQKSHRLKILTDDLFEAAKASSGNIPINYEKIDVVSLITQGLGELNDKIEERDLKFKVTHPKEKLYVRADGKLLWRVIENLLSNIFKYALQGSRVYLNIEDLEYHILITLKNISSQELNISADELVERFKRGDEARTSEGSGLGLSIAKSLIDIQKGSFDIKIDGDLFKVVIEIPKYKE